MSRGSYRYAMHRGGRTYGDPGRTSGVIRTVIMLILAAALVVTLVISMPSMNYRTDYRALTIERIQRECDTAITYSKYLSRTASSNSNSQLAVIRSSVYSIQVLNETYGSMEGGGTRLMEESAISAILSTIDSYYNRLTTGTNTSDQQTELSNQLEALQRMAVALK